MQKRTTNTDTIAGKEPPTMVKLVSTRIRGDLTHGGCRLKGEDFGKWDPSPPSKQEGRKCSRAETATDCLDVYFPAAREFSCGQVLRCWLHVRAVASRRVLCAAQSAVPGPVQGQFWYGNFEKPLHFIQRTTCVILARVRARSGIECIPKELRGFHALRVNF